MKVDHKIRRKFKNATVMQALACIAVVFFLCGCGAQTEKPVTETASVKPGTVATYDSADTAVVLSVNTDEKTITLRNTEVNRSYTLNYDGTTYFYDKYGTALAAAQVKPGTIADVNFLRRSKRLDSLRQSSEAWEMTADSFEIDQVREEVFVGGSTFSCDADTVVVSDGELTDIIEIHSADVLTFRGMDQDVWSISVDKGHGYVRLVNDEYFYGGWVDIGGKVIQKISEGLLLTVPEGVYRASVSAKGVGGTKEITVYRNQETTWDVASLKGEELMTGKVVFSVYPEDAYLYLDGEKVDYSAPVDLEYGIHQMIVLKTGYNTITRYLKVGQPSAGVNISMSRDETVSDEEMAGGDSEADQAALLAEVNKLLAERGFTGLKAEDLTGLTGIKSESSNNPVSQTITSDGTTTTATTGTLSYYVTVEGPTGAEVYVDGNYVGISPISFKKETGSHTVTLRQTGYTARTYTIQVDSDEKNVSYTFPALTPSE